MNFAHTADRFNYRVAGICIDNSRLLLHTSDRDDFWSLPGGRCHFDESSGQALEREMLEELGEEVEAGHLRWVVENFYAWENSQYHEIAFYYDFNLTAASGLVRKQEWHGRDCDLRLTFRWFAPGELAGITIYPSFIPLYAFEEPGLFRHLVWREP